MGLWYFLFYSLAYQTEIRLDILAIELRTWKKPFRANDLINGLVTN